MPVYEFVCQDCGRNFEELCPVGHPKAQCPGCGGERVTKKVSGFQSRSRGGEGSQTSSGGGCSSCHGGHCHSCH